MTGTVHILLSCTVTKGCALDVDIILALHKVSAVLARTFQVRHSPHESPTANCWPLTRTNVADASGLCHVIWFFVSLESTTCYHVDVLIPEIWDDPGAYTQFAIRYDMFKRDSSYPIAQYTISQISSLTRPRLVSRPWLTGARNIVGFPVFQREAF
jgi:hypothetical protein